MSERDFFVALVAFGLGAMMVHSAVSNGGWCFQMALARKVSKHGGHRSARIFIGSIGTFVILLGAYTLFGAQLSNLFSDKSQLYESATQGEAKALLAD